jgi:hypothetical protein
MSHRPSLIQLDPEAATIARVSRMLDVAEHLGLDPQALAFLAHRLAVLGRQREGLGPSQRRDELDGLILGDLEALCRAYTRMARVVERMPRA